MEITEIVLGPYHTVAVLADGSVVCWGNNEYGQCNVPIGVGTPENPVASVAAGGRHTVAVLADGSVACWGAGATNTGSFTNYGQSIVPSGIGTPKNPVAAVAAGWGHTVALLANGSVVCWGDNIWGQCNVPSDIGTPENPIASIAVSGDYNAALLADGSVVCWGNNDFGQCDVPNALRESKSEEDDEKSPLDKLSELDQELRLEG